MKKSLSSKWSIFCNFRACDVRCVCHTQTFDARQGLARLMNVQQTDFGRNALSSLLARSLRWPRWMTSGASNFKCRLRTTRSVCIILWSQTTQEPGKHAGRKRLFQTHAFTSSPLVHSPTPNAQTAHFS
jgi:hypothetical protein